MVMTFRDMWTTIHGMLTGKRNLWETLGYPAEILGEAYWLRYRRDGIGRRCLIAYPDACWRYAPVVQDEQGSSPKKDQKDYSAFTEAWEDLNDRFNILGYMKKADRLSGIEHFSILVVGLNDGGDLKDPIRGEAELLYLQAYAQRSVRISQWNEDRNSPRYGLPLIYTVSPKSDSNTPTRAVEGFDVHWSRVIHIAEGTDEDEVFGTPFLQDIMNDLLDYEKVKGSSAETFWLNARGGLAVQAAADARLSDKAITQMKEQIEEYEQDLRRVLALQGATVNAIQTPVADPKPNCEVLVQRIAGAKGIPMRILMGNEAGQLASSEDSNSFESRVDERRTDHCDRQILRPFINLMIDTGNLPVPQGNWLAKWPEATAASPERQAAIAASRATALAAYANSFADTVVSKEEFREWLGLKPESEYDMADDPGEDLPEDEDGNFIDESKMKDITPEEDDAD